MAAADDLAQGSEIGTKIVQRLGAAEGKAQGDHLVENEDDAVALGLGAQVLEVAVQRGKRAGDAHDGLDDEGGDVVRLGVEEIGDGGFIVEGHLPDEGVVSRDKAGLRLALVDVPVVVGAVVGADGFGFVFETDHYENFLQVGGVEIGDDVEIGANSCVDRGTLDATRIGSGTKLDNLVHVGHNCQIGRHVVMAAQVGLSGGVVVEDYAVLGGQAGIGERARVGAKVQLGGQSGLLPDKTLEAGGAFWGTPARPLREQLSRQALVNRLPRLRDEVSRLRRRIEELESS